MGGWVDGWMGGWTDGRAPWASPPKTGSGVLSHHGAWQSKDRQLPRSCPWWKLPGPLGVARSCPVPLPGAQLTEASLGAAQGAPPLLQAQARCLEASSPHPLGIQRVDRSPQSGDATPPGWEPCAPPHSQQKGISELDGDSALGLVVTSPQICGIDFCPWEMLCLLRCPRGSFVRKCSANGISSHAALTPEDEDFSGVWSRQGHPAAPLSPAVSSWSTGSLSPPSGPTAHRRRGPQGSCPHAHRLTASDRVAWAQRVRVVTAPVSPTSASLSQHPRAGRGLQAFSLMLPP